MTAPGGDEQAPAIALAPLPLAAQLRWLALAVYGLTHRPGDGAGGPVPPPDTFRPSAQQLKTFTIEPVATRSFATVEVADGRIAVDADRATPVYSPFSGRIATLHAGLGDEVAAGAALATIEASEFVQVRSDLATALARKQALYAAQGASLQDVQQAEADRATAEAALAAVESRLAILRRQLAVGGASYLGLLNAEQADAQATAALAAAHAAR